MKYIVILEDTPRGVRAVCSVTGNDVTDNVLESLAGKVLTNWTIQLKELEEKGLLVVESV